MVSGACRATPSGLAFAARSFATLGLAAAAMAIVVSAWLSWLAVSESWDGFFYHEPIVGFALQNQGFRMVDLPPAFLVQGINGYPKLCEAFALWFVIFTDKTLIEIGNTIAAPGLLLATFLIVRRFAKDPVASMGWAAAVLLMPAMLTQLRTSMIDVEVQFFLVAALFYATRAEIDARATALAWLSMALVMGSKSTALVWVPPLAVVTIGRLVARREAPGRGPLLVSLAGVIAVASVGALTFARNWIAFKNPVWPVTVSIPRLGIAWPGVATLHQITPEPPLLELIRSKYQHPVGGIPDIIARDYGYAVPWVIAPLGLVAAAVALVVVLRRRFAEGRDETAEALLLLVALAAVSIKVSPNLNIGRYNVVAVVVSVAAVAWLAARAGERFHEGALAAATMLALVPWIWTDWFFGVDLGFRDIATLVRSSSADRRSMDFATFQMPSDTARAKEKELAGGGVVVFTQDSSFIGALFDHAMDNRLVYVRFDGDDAFLARVAEADARWIVVGERSRARSLLASQPTRFQQVGVAVRQDRTVALPRPRRLTATMPARPPRVLGLPLRRSSSTNFRRRSWVESNRTS